MTYTEKAIAGTWYTITCTAAATVTETIGGETAKLATLSESGTAAFRASTASLTITTDGKYVILPTKAPVGSGSGGGGGTPGAPGISCYHEWNGTTLTVTSASGTSSADLKGEKGDTGPQGPQGEPGSGGDIVFDDTPTEGSTNAVTSGGIYTAMLHKGTGYEAVQIGPRTTATGSAALAIGAAATAENLGNIAIGGGAQAKVYNSGTAIGSSSQSGNSSTAIGAQSKATGIRSVSLGFSATAAAVDSVALGPYSAATESGSIVLSARSSANTKFVLSLIAGTATGDTGSILSETPFMTGSTVKLTVSDGVSGISETLSIDAAALFTMLQSAGGTVTLTNPNA